MATSTEAPERVVLRDPIPGAALAAVGGALLLALCNALSSWVLSRDDLQTTRDYLTLVDEHRTLMLVADGAGLLAAVLLVPGVWAVAHRLREHTPVLGTIGGWLTSAGYVSFMVLVVEGQIALAVIDAGGDPGTYVDAMDNHGTLVQLAIYVVFGVGALLGPVVLGVAMLRQRDSCPTWAGITMVLSAPVRMTGLVAGVFFLPAVASLMLAVAFAVVLGRRTG